MFQEFIIVCQLSSIVGEKNMKDHKKRWELHRKFAKVHSLND